MVQKNYTNIFRLLSIALLLFSSATLGLAQGKGGAGAGGGTLPPPIFNPLSYAFPATALAKTSTGVVNLLNLGSAPVTLSSITLGGVSAADFTITGGTCAVGTVIPQKVGNFCGIQIAFHPQTVGPKAAFITVNSANSIPVTISMTGMGLLDAPVLAGPGPVTWGGTTPVGSSAAPVPIVVEDGGAQTLVLNNFIIGGDNPGDFVFAGAPRGFGGCFPGEPLSPQSFCAFNVNFKPTDVGVRNATVTFFSNDPANPVIVITLSAVAIAGPPPPPPPPPPPAPPTVVSFFDFTDFWTNSAEPGWSLSVIHHKVTTDVLTATWQTFDVDGRDMWLKLADGQWVNGLTYTGNLHRATGPAFSIPYDPNLLVDSVVGTATISFIDANSGTLTYTVNGVSGSKPIFRSIF